jgi:hypothetical protein
MGGPREPQRRLRIARAPQAIRKENEHHRVQRVFFLPLCVVFKDYAICLRVHLLPGKEEIPGSLLKNESLHKLRVSSCRQLWYPAPRIDKAVSDKRTRPLDV